MGSTCLDLGAAIWSLLLFIPIFLALLLLGLIKALIVGPIALVVIFVGNVAVALGLWPAFIYWTYESVLKTRQLGLSLKLVGALFLVPLALILWPSIAIHGSLFAGLGYGFFTPLVATFEAVGEERTNKVHSAFMDGTVDTVKGSCTVVRDFTDWCYHSCPAYLADFRDATPVGGPYTIRFVEIPQCLIIAVLGVIVDVTCYTLLAVLKVPIMLLKGWARLLDDLIVSRDGACLKVACVPIAGLAIVLWPLVVQLSLVAAVIAGVCVGLYAVVIVHKERSFKSGLAYIVTMVAEFDEYTNDMLYLREGTCFPRPSYGSVSSDEIPGPTIDQIRSIKQPASEQQKPGQATRVLLSSKSLKQSIQEVKMVQVWEHMFKTCAKYSQELIQRGVLTTSDLEAYLNDKNTTLIAVKIPAYSLLRDLLASAKSSSTGLVLYNGVELTMFNRPQDRIMDWFFEPLMILKEQLKAAALQPREERYLEKLVLLSPDAEWDGSVEPSSDVRKGELQALGRRIQGISTSVSRFPTFRRRYEKFIKSLLLYAQTRGQNSTSSHAFTPEFV